MCRDYQDISEISNPKNPDVAFVSDVNNICRKSICGKSEWAKKKKKKVKQITSYPDSQCPRLISKPGLNPVWFNQHVLSPRHSQVKRNGEMKVE